MCDNGKIVRATFGLWGLVSGSCPNYDMTYLCHKDVSIKIEKECVGKEKCENEAKEENFTDPN